VILLERKKRLKMVLDRTEERARREGDKQKHTRLLELLMVSLAKK